METLNLRGVEVMTVLSWDWRKHLANLVIDHPEWRKAPQFREELRKQHYPNLSIDKMPLSLSSIQKVLPDMIAKRDEQLADNGQDIPWSMASLDRHPITPTGIAILFDLDKYSGSFLTSVRRAKWIDRLTRLPKISVVMLIILSGLYEIGERTAELNKEKFDSSEFDSTVRRLVRDNLLSLTDLDKFNQYIRLFSEKTIDSNEELKTKKLASDIEKHGVKIILETKAKQTEEIKRVKELIKSWETNKGDK